MNFVKKNLFPIVASVLALVAICLLFGTCAEVAGSKGNITYSGFQLIFGYSEKVLGQTVEVIGFGFGGLVALILLIAGAVLAYFDKVPFGNYISGGLLLVGAILVFVLPQMAAIEVELNGAACLYISGVLAVLGAAAMIAKPFVKIK